MKNEIKGGIILKKIILISGVILALIGGGFVAEATEEKVQTIGGKSEARITNGMTTDTGSFVDTSGYERIGIYAKNNTGEKANTAQVIVVDESSGQEVFKIN